MVGLSENNITVIQHNDPDVPDFLDFKKLRKEGLEHIGNLSGKIWTDHNAHDPGITILEVLVYALMDLGYRANLPFKDLIARKDYNEKDDNFLTPLEILTNNPVTITDYRKLLLEIEGVLNAWLEPTDQEVNLYIDQHQNSLSCSKPTNPPCMPIFNAEGQIFIDEEKCNDWLKYEQIKLNGLYKIYIEKELGADDASIRKKAIELLSAHRNLCEDFVDIQILEQIEFGVCVDVEILKAYEPKILYAKILKAIRAFIQPEIKYYTLNELLNKGKTIDDIFAGRPYSEDSFGFVDTDELEQLTKRTHIHLSDLYQVILNIEGVRKIKKIHIKKGTIESLDWSHALLENQVPVFSIEDTCIDVYSEEGILKINKIHIEKSLSFAKKFKLPLTSLDTEIPIGMYHEDLDDYYSIQHDFPVVYAIGEEGLPESASLERKTQALQLKGYLMFYDQLLANYASQLANIRSLFSLKTESEKSLYEKRTYFTQLPDSVPGLEELLRFYNGNMSQIEGSILAYPVANDASWEAVLKQLEDYPRTEFIIGNSCEETKGLAAQYLFPSASNRSIFINQLVDAFDNRNYTIQILQDGYGYFFVLHSTLLDTILLVGAKKYKTIVEAKNEAKNTAFFAAMPSNYNLVTHKSTTLAPDKHYFGITANPISYLELIQELTENKTDYIARRKQFLDHLLARFGENFTDYALLQYQGKLSELELDQKMIEDQSEYINEFAELSRNRAKAFDYLKPSWNTDNVSGFEKRISLRSGFKNYNRRNLCNFEVLECHKLILNDPNGNLLFRGNTSYESKEELKIAAKKVLIELRDPDNYKKLEKKLNGFNAEVVGRLFSEKPTEENIQISKYHYYQQLVSADQAAVVQSKNKRMASNEIAVQRKDAFIQKINEQTILATSKDKAYRLLPIEKEDHYLNVNAIDYKINTLISWKWHIKEANSAQNLSSSTTFDTKELAWQQLIEQPELEQYVTLHSQAYKWSLKIAETPISFYGSGCYAYKENAIAAWRKAKVSATNIHHFSIEKDEDSYRILLKNEKKKVIATSNSFKEFNETIIETCTAIFKERSTKPNYDSVKNKIGFKIPINETTQLVSHAVYDSYKEAITKIDATFKLGIHKKNYLQSGDEGNPEYNFLLKDSYDEFLALLPEDFETADQRNASFSSVIEYFKTNKPPIIVKEEPRRYTWALLQNEKTLLNTTANFSSKARALSDFDNVIAQKAVEDLKPLCEQHIYKFEVVKEPAEYKFIYGNSDTTAAFNPVFISEAAYKTEAAATEAYSTFLKKLPTLSLNISEKNKEESAFSLQEKNTALVQQYKESELLVENYNEKEASVENAKEVLNYIGSIYNNDGVPNEEFINSEMAENEKVAYEWRFYKKNTPIAKNIYSCYEKEQTQNIKRTICEETPPISLKDCPPKQIIVCPRPNINLYHYQVCFTTVDGKDFRLISYVGYSSQAEAEEAWQKEWLEVIQLAQHKEEYDAEGKISTEEVYKDPESTDCNKASFIAVIPKNIKDQIGGDDSSLVDYYVQLAALFPIYKVEIDDDEIDETLLECKNKYKYRVVIPEKELITVDENCSLSTNQNIEGTWLWDSVVCFDTIEEAIHEYQHFHDLVGTANNCRILCENGTFYVGLFEVLAESSCDYSSESEAWDHIFPSDEKDACGDCKVGGLRAFVYATEEDRNFIPICDQQYWKFKVVSSDYFITDHTCWYHSEKDRDEHIDNWRSILANIDWSKYIINNKDQNEGENGNAAKQQALEFIKAFINKEKNDIHQLCEYVEIVRKCFAQCVTQTTDVTAQKEAFLECFLEHFPTEYENDDEIEISIDAIDFDYINYLIHYFPVFKTDQGYCYRLYWPKDNEIPSTKLLQPCGCGETSEGEENTCNETYSFISSNYYSCCTQALQEFIRFCELVASNSYSIKKIAASKHGPYSFQIIDPSKELAYHPQQYTSLQEVEDAIEMTKSCIDNEGMHLLEHLLVRPKNTNQCHQISINENENQHTKSCLLPICPDYNCGINWQPDLDKDDPCIDNPEVNMINYLPGSDPYSFWATVVLPSWVKRFRTQESRQLFEKLLYKEAPALVGLHILWLGPHDMCKFEDAYKRWLSWLQVSELNKYDPENPLYDPIKNLCEPEKGLPICEIADCIKTLKTEPTCPSIPGEQGDCNCKNEETRPIDECCLPSDTEGTIFWACCEQEVIDVEQPNDVDTINTIALASKAEEIEEPEIIVTDETSKKEIVEEEQNKASEQEVLSLVRKRKPKYLSNIKTIADEDIQKTKSYERTEFFIKNTPTVASYSQLVKFFKQYSLQKDNNVESYLALIKNATWHLLDNLVLNQKTEIQEKTITDLKVNLNILKDKGLSLNETAKEWKIGDIALLTNTKTLNRINEILK